MAAELAIKITADGKAVVTAVQQTKEALQSIDAQAGKTAVSLQGTAQASAGLDAAMQKLDASAARAGAGGSRMASEYSGLASVVKTAAESFSVAEQKMIDGLRNEFAALGMTRSEIEKYTASQAGMSTAAQKQIAAIGQKIDAWHREEAAAKAAASAQDKMAARQDAFIASLKSQADTLGMSRKQLLEYQAAQMGIGDKASPLIQKLYGTEDALNKTGISAKQTAAALRGVPAQFTDIAVSLQGGQAPLTVFLQQGGQLKDMFGGAGAAARALGGYVLGLINPFTAGAAVVGVLAVAYEKGAAESRAFENAATLSGNAVGVSTSQFGAMTQSMAAVAGTRGKAAEALTEIARTGQLAGTQIEAIGTAAILMEKATGQAISETVAQFVRLADEPVKASLALNQQYNYLTAAVYAQIKALVEQGNKLGAAELAEKSYADALAARARTVIENAGLMERAWRGITGAAKSAWDAMLGVGRASTGSDQLAILEKQLAERQARNSNLGIKDGRVTQELQAQIGYLQETVRMEGKAAEGAAERARVNAAGMAAVDAVSKVNEQAASKQDKMNKALEAYRTNLDAIRAASPESPLLYAKTIAAAEAGIREQYKETARVKKAAATPITGESEVAGIRAKVIETQRYIDTMKTQGLAAAQQTEGERLVIKIQQELEGSLKGVARANKEKALSAATALAAVQKEKNALEALLKAQKDFDSARDKEIFGQETSILKLEEKAQAMEDQVRMYGLSQQALEALSVARLQERADILAGFAGSEEQIVLIQKEIDARKRLAVATDARDGLDAGVKAAKEADAEWKKTAHSIENTLTDSLMRAFEGGKSFAQAMGDTIVNMFKTMVLRPVVQAVMSPVSSAIGSALGLPGAANAGQSGLSTLSSLANIGSTIGGGITQTIANVLPSAVSASLGMSSSALIASNAALAGGGASGAAAAAAAGAAGNATALGGMGAALGAIPVWGWAALAAAVIIPSLMGKNDARFGSQGSYTPGGGSKSAGGPNGASDDFGGLSASNKAAAMGIDALLEKLGSKERLTYLAGGFESSEKGKGFSYAGGILSSGKTFGQGTDGNGYNNNRGSMSPEEAQASYITELKQATLQALQSATDIPKSIADTLAGVNIDALTGDALDQLKAKVDAQVTDLLNFKATLDLLPFDYLAGQSLKTLDGLAALAGGMDKLGATLSSYYDNFYSEQEKAAILTANTTKAFADLGIVMPAMDDSARAWYRSEVERLGAMDLSVEANAKAYASVLQLNGAVNTLAPAFDSAANAAIAAAARMQSQASSLASEYLEGSVLRDFRAREIQGTLASGGISLTTDQILQSSRADYLAALQSVAGDDKKTQALLDVGRQFADLNPKIADGSTTMFGGSTGSSGGGSSPATSAVNSLISTIQELNKTMLEAVASDSLAGFAQLQASFAIETAKAQAGDTTAQAGLPELAKMLVAAGKDNSRTALDQILLTARTVEALGSVAALAGAAGDSSGASSVTRGGYGTTFEENAIAEYWKHASSLDQPAPGQLEAIKQYLMWKNGQTSKLDSSYAPWGPDYKPTVGNSAPWVPSPAPADIAASNEKFLAQFGRLPGFAIGTDYVPRDMLAMIHEGERIVPKAFNPAIGNGLRSDQDNAELVAEIRALRQEVAALRASAEQTAANTRKTATTLDDAAVGVRPLTTMAA